MSDCNITMLSSLFDGALFWCRTHRIMWETGPECTPDRCPIAERNDPESPTVKHEPITLDGRLVACSACGHKYMRSMWMWYRYCPLCGGRIER
jgi:hypothetical protein